MSAAAPIERAALMVCISSSSPARTRSPASRAGLPTSRLHLFDDEPFEIGEIIDLYPKSADGGYDPQGFQTGFGVFLLVQLAALAWYLYGMRRLRQDGIVRD